MLTRLRSRRLSQARLNLSHAIMQTMESRRLLSGHHEFDGADHAGHDHSELDHANHADHADHDHADQDGHRIDHGGVWPEGTPQQFQVNPGSGRWTFNAGGSTGSVGNPTTLTWGFIADGTNITRASSIPSEATGPSSLQARLNTLYGSSATWQPLFQQVFDRWSAISGLTFTYRGLSDDGAAFPSSPGNASRPDIRIGGHSIDGGSGSNILAYNYFPNTGDMVIDTDNFNAGSFYPGTANNSRGLRNVVAHEIGHGLGFDHVDPVSQTKLMEPFVSLAFDGQQFDDFLIAQRQYGDPFEKGGRNETPATASSLSFAPLSNGFNTVLSQWGSANAPTNARSIANTSDADYLSFTISSSKNASFTVSPFGPTYTQGPQGGATSSFNASANGNLALTLFGTDGTTVISTANVNAAGGTETVTATGLAPGTYYLRVNSTAGDVQAYDLRATISTAEPPPPAPTTPDIVIGSDSGVSNTDDVTNDTTPTFTGFAEPFSTVVIRVDGVQVASGVASNTAAWTITVPALSNGSHTVTATASNSGGAGPASATLNMVVDTISPLLSPTQFRRSPNQLVEATFNEFIFGTGTLALTNTTTAQSFATAPSSLDVNQVAYNITANALTDGRYSGTINMAGITDRAGNVAIGSNAVAFNFLRADFNTDDNVNFADLVTLAQNYNLTGRAHIQGDANYDGTVNFADLVILAQAYNTSLPPLPAAASSVFASGKSISLKRKGDEPGATALI